MVLHLIRTVHAHAIWQRLFFGQADEESFATCTFWVVTFLENILYHESRPLFSCWTTLPRRQRPTFFSCNVELRETPKLHKDAQTCSKDNILWVSKNSQPTMQIVSHLFLSLSRAKLIGGHSVALQSREGGCSQWRTYSLVQWNWFSDITGCTWISWVRWCQRTNFTAPGCMQKCTHIRNQVLLADWRTTKPFILKQTVCKNRRDLQPALRHCDHDFRKRIKTNSQSSFASGLTDYETIHSQTDSMQEQARPSTRTQTLWS